MQRILHARFSSAPAVGSSLLRAAENAAAAAGRPVRVRFAPSPTGSLHLGGLRSALFNYLFAKSAGGTFILRIEDTDKTRQKPGSITGLVTSLRWCGLDYDEGPVPKADADHDCMKAGCAHGSHASPEQFSESTALSAADAAHAEASQFDSKGAYGPYIQSQRLPLYRAEVDRLLASGQAYRCFCTPERLAALRESQAKAGVHNPVYDRACLKLPPGEADARAAAGQPHVVRMLVPTGSTTLVDEVLGDVSFTHAGVDDQVLLKSDGYPTYHLASVVDDHAMAISHVIRGQEWLSSSPKHVLLYKALGWTPPAFAHLPLLLNADRSKLSKRHGDASVEDFRAAGYTPEALVNFVAFLGWSPPLPGQVHVPMAEHNAVSAGPSSKAAAAGVSSTAVVSGGKASGSGGGKGKINPFKVTLPSAPSPTGKAAAKPAAAEASAASSASPLSSSSSASSSSSPSASSSSWLPAEVLTLPAMASLFTLARVNKANAVVDVARLDFLNGLHIRRMLLGAGAEAEGAGKKDASNGGDAGGAAAAASTAGSNSSSTGASAATVGSAGDGLAPGRAMSQAAARALPKAALLPLHVADSADARAVRRHVQPLLVQRYCALATADPHAWKGPGDRAIPHPLVFMVGRGLPHEAVEEAKGWTPTRWNGLLVAQHERVHRWADFPDLLLPLALSAADDPGDYARARIGSTATSAAAASAQSSNGSAGDADKRALVPPPLPGSFGVWMRRTASDRLASLPLPLPGSFGVWMRRTASDRLAAIEKACAGARKAAGLPPAAYPLPAAAPAAAAPVASAGAAAGTTGADAAAAPASAAAEEYEYALAAALRTADADVRALLRAPAVRSALCEVLARWEALAPEPPAPAPAAALSNAVGSASRTTSGASAAAASAGRRSFLDGDAAYAVLKDAPAAAGVPLSLPSGALLPLLRYLMTGAGVGPALSSTLRLLGQRECCARLRAWLD